MSSTWMTYEEMQRENYRRRELGLEILFCEWCGERVLNRDMVKRDEDSICQRCAERD